MSYHDPRAHWQGSKPAGEIEAEGRAGRGRFTRLKTLLPTHEDDPAQGAAEAAPRREQFAQEFEDSGAGWFWETDRAGRLTYLSRQIAETLTGEPDGLIGTEFDALFHCQADSDAAEQTVDFLLNARLPFANSPVCARAGEAVQWWSLSGRPFTDANGNFHGFRGHGTNLSEQERIQAEATRKGQFDALTGLANRASMQQTLGQALAPEGGHVPGCALFMMDLDRFKAVNDKFGHPVGDALLIMVAERARAEIGDHGRLGRLGGDEFMIIFPGETSKAVLAEIARSLIASLTASYDIEGAQISIGASIGIAIAPYDGDTPETLIAHADMALYASKYSGRGVHRFYEAELTDAATERKTFERDVRTAVMNNSFSLVFQPFMNAQTGALSGFEILLRWDHQERGQIPPSQFLPVVDELGLAPRLGEWVIFNACREAAKWPEAVRVAVNVSEAQLAKDDLFKTVAASLEMTNIPANRLELDISEQVVTRDREAVSLKLAELKRLGVRISLDDFGAREISLANMRNTSIDKIKFDPAFVLAASDGKTRDAAIIRAIVSLADSLGIETLAEGLESENDAALARLVGCTSLQGFVFGHPLDAERAETLAIEGTPKPSNMEEKRAAPRVTLYRAAVMRHCGLDYKVIVRNISMLGASIECPLNLEPGARVALDLGVTEPIEAKIAWSHDARLGLDFDTRFDMGLLNAFQRPARLKR